MDTNLIISLISKIRRDSSEFIEKELSVIGAGELIASHGSILGALYRNNGKLKMKDIAHTINRDKSTVTYLVKVLCDSEYVTRQKGSTDSRETYIVFTEKGWNLKEQYMSLSKKLIETVYRGFSDEEKQKVLDLLVRIDNNLLDSRANEIL